MEILSDLKSFRPDPSVPLILGIGNFDGIHIGHQKLMAHVIRQARAEGGRSGVLTFQVHPQQILHPDQKPKLLMSREQKLFFLEELGIELCFLIPFTPDVARICAKNFVKDWLVERLQVKEVCIGYNAHFGHDREGDAGLMQALGQEYGFKFEKIEPVQAAGDYVSSSRIRRLVTAGNLEEARQCLGRPFSVLGKIVKGSGRGRKLGFPTANLELTSDILPPVGIYPVMVRELDLERSKNAAGREIFRISSRGQWLCGVLSYGTRPTFNKLEGEITPCPVPEVYILDFERELYGKTMELAFYPKLRSEATFASAQALQHQIAEDIKEARRYFKSLPNKNFTRLGSLGYTDQHV